MRVSPHPLKTIIFNECRPVHAIDHTPPKRGPGVWRPAHSSAIAKKGASAADIRATNGPCSARRYGAYFSTGSARWLVVPPTGGRFSKGTAMGFYENWILPPILDLVMQQKQLLSYRRTVVGAARGKVLEIGAGSGLNFTFYGDQVERVFALDPSPRLLGFARGRVSAAT